MSLAQRQLVEIARALAFRSRLIIMDEPTAPLTGKDAEGLFRTIRTLRDKGVSVIYISHRLREIFEVTDRVTVMRDGRRVFTRDTSVTTQEELVRAMVGEDLKARLTAQRPAPAERQQAEALRIEGASTSPSATEKSSGWPDSQAPGAPNCSNGCSAPSTGSASRILVNGLPVNIRSPRDAIRHGMGLVPDDRKAKGLVLGASLSDNIALPGRRDRLFLRAPTNAAPPAT